MATPESPRRGILSFWETVSIAAVDEARAKILEAHFTKSERARLDGKPTRSIAGVLALKSAVCRLASALDGAVRLPLYNIEIKRDRFGAPGIGAVSCPDENLKAILAHEVHLSMAHSRESAVGLAVISEVIDRDNHEKRLHATQA